MQQHTGQHILSAVFLEVMGANTIGFHLGSESSTIDLDIDTITKQEIYHVEERSNHFIWENHPVKIRYITDDEIHTIPFRKPPQVTGKIRVIRIGDLDASACGGTHVSHTGEIGLIKVTGSERYKGGMRIHFLCGQRAFQDYHRMQTDVQKLSMTLSIHPDDLPLPTGPRINWNLFESMCTCANVSFA